MDKGIVFKCLLGVIFVILTYFVIFCGVSFGEPHVVGVAPDEARVYELEIDNGSDVTLETVQPQQDGSLRWDAGALSLGPEYTFRARYQNPWYLWSEWSAPLAASSAEPSGVLNLVLE